MTLDKKLLETLVCPQCRGALDPVEGGWALVCDRCKLKYPVRDGIPMMLAEEAVDLRGGSHPVQTGNVKLPRVMFRVIEGPDSNMTFHLEHGTCRAIGRASSDTSRTMVFNVDLAMALDESTKGLVLKYIEKQFGKGIAGAKQKSGNLGGFRRTSDVVLTDTSLSKLHAMIFSDATAVGVLDLVSKNGTFVNGAEVESKVLKRGDKIEIGDTTIIFEG